MDDLQDGIKENLIIQKKFKRKKYTKPLIFNIIDHFISVNNLICYGGIAINTIIPKERFYDEIDIPDYDCFSTNALNDAKKLSILLSKHETIEVKSAMFKGTYKIYVNFIPMVDFTQIDTHLFKKIKDSALKIKDIYYSSPNYLRMNIHLELSRPLGDIDRWNKIYHRLELLNKYYPFTYTTNINVIPVTNIDIYNDVATICKKWPILGEYAMKYYYSFFPKKINISNSNIFIFSETLGEVKHALKGIKYKIVSYSNKFISNFYEFIFNGESLLYVFITDSCQSYNEIKEKGEIIKVANIDSMLMIYYALSFIQPPSLNINNLLVYCYLLQNMNISINKSKNKNILKRFHLPCIGNQSTFEDIRRERDKMFKLYKKNRSKKIYNNYFFRFVPNQTRKNKI